MEKLRKKEGVAVMVGFEVPDLTLFESSHRVPQESGSTRVAPYGTANCRHSLPNHPNHANYTQMW